MKKIVLGILLMLNVITTSAQELTAEKIIDQYVENVGGKEAWAKLKGKLTKSIFEIIGTGMQIPLIQYELKDGRQIAKFEVM